ncbi:MAG: DUF4368 domain-containing protein, partial [Hominilimicola sp.]
EKTVLNELNALANEFLNQDEIEQKIEWNNNLKEQQSKIQKTIKAQQTKIDEYSKSIKEIYVDKVKGIISEQDYVQFTEDFAKDRKRIEKEIADEKQQLEDIELKIANGDNRAELLSKYMNMDHLTREAVETLIDHIEIGNRDKKTNTQPIEIFWNF